MMKLVVLCVLVAVCAADLVSRQRAVIPHHSKFGHGVSSRYFDKVEATGHHVPKYDDDFNYGYGPVYDGYDVAPLYSYGPAHGGYGAELKYGYGPVQGLKYGYGPTNGLKYGKYGAGLGLGYSLGHGGYGWAYPGVFTAVTV